MSGPGFEPRTLLLWGNSANHLGNMLPKDQEHDHSSVVYQSFFTLADIFHNEDQSQTHAGHEKGRTSGLHSYFGCDALQSWTLDNELQHRAYGLCVWVWACVQLARPRPLPLSEVLACGVRAPYRCCIHMSLCVCCLNLISQHKAAHKTKPTVRHFKEHLRWNLADQVLSDCITTGCRKQRSCVCCYFTVFSGDSITEPPWRLSPSLCCEALVLARCMRLSFLHSFHCFLSGCWDCCETPWLAYTLPVCQWHRTLVSYSNKLIIRMNYQLFRLWISDLFVEYLTYFVGKVYWVCTRHGCCNTQKNSSTVV